MIKIGIGSRQVRIKGWEGRHTACPHLAQEYERALSDGRRHLMLRGQQEMPSDDFYYIGQKSRPCRHGGAVAKVRRHARRLASDGRESAKLALSYANSPMPRKCDKAVKCSDLLRIYHKSDAVRKYVLAQLLLEGLHFQNNQPEVREWRDYPFVISCSTDYQVALRYALSAPHSLPMQGFVLEYAPPVGSNLYRDVNDVRAHFRQRGLRIYGNRDAEIFVPFAMSPEYLLGHVELRMQSGDTYVAAYHPNPHYASGRATLDSPPDLSDRQRELLDETRKWMAWVSYIPTRAGGEWGDLILPDRIEPIGPPRSTQDETVP